MWRLPPPPPAHDEFGHGGSSLEIEKRNDDDSFAGASVVDGTAGLIYVSRAYGGYWDWDGNGNTDGVHFDESDCFLAVSEAVGVVGGGGGTVELAPDGDAGRGDDRKFTHSGMNDAVFGEPGSGGGNDSDDDEPPLPPRQRHHSLPAFDAVVIVRSPLGRRRTGRRHPPPLGPQP